MLDWLWLYDSKRGMHELSGIYIGYRQGKSKNSRPKLRHESVAAPAACSPEI